MLAERRTPARSLVRALACALGLALLPGCGVLYRSAGVPKGWFVGVAEPEILLEYRDNVGAEPYCRSADQLMNRLADDVTAERDSTGCAAQASRDLSGGQMVDIQCPVTQAVNGCRDVYRAMVWGERLPRSTTHYDLVSLGWVVRRCSSTDENVRSSDEAVAYALGVSMRMRSFLDKCEAREIADLDGSLRVGGR